MNMKVLVIAIDHGIQCLLASSLPEAIFQVCSANYDVAIKAIEREQPDILLTEYTDLCVSIHQHWPRLPIIAVLDATQEQSISQVLDAGADHCAVKPFGPAELGARMRALVRRTRPETSLKEATPDILCSGDGYIRMSVSSHTVFVGGKQISLTRIEFALLRELMTHSERVLTHRFLLQHVWGAEYGDEDEYVRIYIYQLRSKVEPNPSRPLYILTEAGVGYVFRSTTVALPRIASQGITAR